MGSIGSYSGEDYYFRDALKWGRKPSFVKGFNPSQKSGVRLVGRGLTSPLFVRCIAVGGVTHG